SVIADFEAWVQMGAPDPRASFPATAQSKSVAPKAVDHWAFKPVSPPAIPQVEDPKQFVCNPIDNFILDRLKANNLAPTPKADKYTLIRRVSYDLTGLPPTPEEVANFIADQSPAAFEKVVDRLLDAPSYGERWGRHWLDIARYADTSGDRQTGRATMTVYPGAWTYRDYVINAFNKDLPYDQFILQQIAADRLPESKTDKSMLAALGFLTVGKRFMGNENDLLDDRIDVVTKGLMGLTAACARCHDHKFDPIPTRDYYALHGVFASSEEPAEGPLLQPAEERAEHQDYLLEAAKITQEGKTYVQSEGTRLICGILERAGDYLMAIREAGSTVESFKKNGNFRLWAKQKGLKAEVAAVAQDQVIAAEVRNKRNPDPILGPWFALNGLPAEAFSEKAAALLEEMRGGARCNMTIVDALIEKAPGSVEDVAQVYNTVLASLHKALELPEYEGIKVKRGSITELRKSMVPLKDPRLESLRNDLFGSNSKWLPEDRLLAKTLGASFLNPQAAIRGKMASLNLTHPGAPVRAMTLVDKARPKDSNVLLRGEPGNLGPVVPRHFPTLLGGDESKPFTDGSGRLELARAIASPENPLTARVIVNRVWQWHFGQAIVRTVSDFGTRSEPPTHPELIDWLANYLVGHNWSLKQLNKLIVLSGAYQQDSIPSEAGMALDPTNQWLWRFNVQRLDFEQVRDTLLTVGAQLETDSIGGRPFQLSGDSSLGTPKRNKFTGVDTSALSTSPNRRSVYAMIDRAGLPEIFNTFDFANPEVSTGERVLTTVPQQSLFMMNSPFVAAQVRSLVQRKDFPANGSDEERIRFIFATALQRLPTPEEVEFSKRFLAAEPRSLVETNALLAANSSAGGLKKANAAAPQHLSSWERYAQVVLLTNELMFIR
ncbi:MAG: DUF1553 domain-containing protein, partial [Verrucomicrobia bacterium]|nr:DUF1553 domain-containing protein [Verrucomicrobiota bacterium]